MIRLLAAALSATVAHGWWRDEDTHTRGESPYPYPATHKDGTAPVYNVVNEVDGPQDGKINVHLVPHTHDDTGWLVTVDQYFFQEVYYVVDTVVDQLVKNPKRHFIYVVRR
jgi:alpha-mannosidase